MKSVPTNRHTERARREAEHADQMGGFVEIEPPLPIEERDEPLGIANAPPTFPLDSLPAPLRPFAVEVARACNCRVDSPGAAMLAATSGALGAARHVNPDGNFPTHANIYIAIVGDSGSGKTPSLSKSFAPLRSIDADLIAAYATSLESYRREKREFEKNLVSWKKCESEPQPIEPSRPPQQRLLMSDLTTAAMVRALRDSPRGVTLLYDELAAWLGAMNQFTGGRGTDRQQFLSAWSMEPVKVSRKGDGDEVDLFVARPYLTICGNLVPSTLRELIEKSRAHDDGLLARFLLVNLTSLPASGEVAPTVSSSLISLWDWTIRRLRRGVRPPDSESDERPHSAPPLSVGRSVGPRLAVLDDETPDWVTEAERSDETKPVDQGIASGPRNEGLIELSPDAFEVYKEFRREHAAEINNENFDSCLRSSWEKLLSGWSRLLLILHAMRWGSNEDGVGDADPGFAAPIEAVTAKRATLLIAYFKQQVSYAHGQAAIPETEQQLGRVWKWLRGRGEGPITARDVAQRFSGEPELASTEKAGAVLEILLRRGVLQRLPRGQNQRSNRYIIAPYK